MTGSNPGAAVEASKGTYDAPPANGPIGSTQSSSLDPSTDIMTADASGLAGASDVASIGSDLGSDFSAGLDDLGGFAKRGGLIGHYDTGGTPTYNQPSDANQDDSGSGGDVPYDSGTGMKGFDIPDERSNNKLAVAPPPQSNSSSGGGGGFNPASLVGPILGIFGLAGGGLAGETDAHHFVRGGLDPSPMASASGIRRLGYDAGGATNDDFGAMPDPNTPWQGSPSLVDKMGGLAPQAAQRGKGAVPVTDLSQIAAPEQGGNITVNKAAPVVTPEGNIPAHDVSARAQVASQPQEAGTQGYWEPGGNPISQMRVA